jgi:hypothetical protein
MSKAKKVKNALTLMLSFCSMRSRTSSQACSSWADSEIEVDPLSPAVRGSSLRQQAEVYTLLRDSQIKFQDDQEKEVYKLLKDKEFTSTPVIDPDLLQTIGMDSEFQLIFQNVGWEDA